MEEAQGLEINKDIESEKKDYEHLIEKIESMKKFKQAQKYGFFDRINVTDLSRYTQQQRDAENVE